MALPTVDEAADFDYVRNKLLEFAADKDLRRGVDGRIYHPIEGGSYAFLCEYEDYVDEVLMADEYLACEPDRYKDAIQFLKFHNNRLPTPRAQANSDGCNDDDTHKTCR